MRAWKTILVALALAHASLAAAQAHHHALRFPAKGTPYALARASLLKQGLAPARDPDVISAAEHAARSKKGLSWPEDVPSFDPSFRELHCSKNKDNVYCRALFFETDPSGWRTYVIVEVDPKDHAVTSASYATTADALPPIPPPLARDVPQLKGSYLKARKTLRALGFHPARNRNPMPGDVAREAQCSGTGMGFCLAYWISRDGRVLCITTIGDYHKVYYVEWSSWKEMKTDDFTSN
jgi:hypothetical protein